MEGKNQGLTLQWHHLDYFSTSRTSILKAWPVTDEVMKS
jgi:hypothetical protein